MMVNCPKCGFPQPKDQYCAKCGVDMITFEPVTRPLFGRILASTAFQISALALVLVTGGLYLRHADQDARAKLIRETPIANEVEVQEKEIVTAQADPVTNPNDDLRQTVSSSEKLASAQAAAQPAAPLPAAALAQTGFAAASSPAVGIAATPTPAASTAAGLRSALAPASQFRVNFIEIQRSLLSTLMSEAQQGANEGAISYGVISNLDQKLKASRAWQTLDSAGDQSIRLNQPNVIFKGARDQASGQNVGLTVQITALSRDELATHFQIDANRSLIGASGAPELVDFQMPESFTVPKGGAFLIAGVLPHRALSEAEDRLYRGVSVLKSMSTEAFRSGNTEVAIVVETR